jgi:hypothetical protein
MGKTFRTNLRMQSRERLAYYEESKKLILGNTLSRNHGSFNDFEEFLERTKV